MSTITEDLTDIPTMQYKDLCHIANGESPLHTMCGAGGEDFFCCDPYDGNQCGRPRCPECASLFYSIEHVRYGDA